VGGGGLRAHRSPQCSPPCLEPPASWCRAGSPCRLSVHLGCFKLATRRFNSWFSFLLSKMAAGQDRRAGEGRHPPSVSIKPIKNAHTPATKYQPNLSTTFSFQSPWKNYACFAAVRHETNTRRKEISKHGADFRTSRECECSLACPVSNRQSHSLLVALCLAVACLGNISALSHLTHNKTSHLLSK
jgi:hypothetical protein